MAAQTPSCVVLGGGGFIGTNLCRRLAADGHRVRAFGRRRLFPRELSGVEWCEGDFNDPVALRNAIESFDVVFHLIHATMPRAADLDMAADIRHNIIPTLGLLGLCGRDTGRRVVFVSSGGTIYGRAQQVPTPESAPAEPICAYGISKLAIEKYLALHEHLHGLDFRVLRVTNPFGPFQIALKNQGVVAALIASGLSGERMEIWGDGSVVRDFVFVGDAVEALVAAAGDGSGERIFNIGSGEGRGLREVIAVIERIMRVRINIEWTPGRPLDVPVSVVDIGRAREFLNWAPETSFEIGLERTIEWGRQTGYFTRR